MGAYLAVLLILPPMLGVAVSQGWAEKGPRWRVAVVRVDNSSSYTRQGFEGAVREKLAMAYARHAAFRSRDLGIVDSAVKAVNPAEWNDAAMQAVGEKAEVDLVVAARVVGAEVKQAEGTARVTLEARAVSTATGQMVNRTLVSVWGPARKNYQGDAASLVDEAVVAAAGTMVDEMGSGLGLLGHITEGKPDHIWTQFMPGGGPAVAKGAELVIVREGQPIARAEVTEAQGGNVGAVPIAATVTAQPRLGDEVRVLYNPSPTMAVAEKPPAKKGASLGRILGWAVALYATWAIVRHKEKAAGVQTQVSGITMVADALTVPADGTSSIKVTVRLKNTSGNPVSGVQVTFALQAVAGFPAGDLGVIESPVVTDALGEATAKLTAGKTSTRVDVAATAGAQTATLRVIYGASPPAQIVLAANPTSIPADGTSISQVTATVTDWAGANVADGTLVSFATNLGTLSQATAPTIGGNAVVVLTSTATSGVAAVTAKSGIAAATIGIPFTPVATTEPNSIVLAAAANPVYLGATGLATTTITATLRDATGNLVGAGVLVNFATDLGSITGTALTVGATGQATATFSSGRTGVATITATSGAVSKQILITVNPGPPASITITANPTVVEANGQSNSVISALVLDNSGNPATDGTVVNFSAQVATVGGLETTTITPTASTNGGVAMAVLISRVAGTSTPNNPGTVTVTATVPAQTPPLPSPIIIPLTVSGTPVTYVSQVVSAIAVGANPLNIRGLDRVNETSTVTAMVFDAFHNPVVDGTAVYFTSSAGVIRGTDGTVGGVARSLTTNGIATAVLASAADGSDPTFDGWVDVTVIAGGPPGAPSAFTYFAPNLVLFSGPAVLAGSSVTLSQPSMHQINDAIAVSIIAHDRNNNPVVDGTSVTVEADLGNLTSGALTTVGGFCQTKIKSVVVENPVGSIVGTRPGTGHLLVTVATGLDPLRFPPIDYTVIDDAGILP